MPRENSRIPKKLSAGILLYRRRAGALEVFIVHPGGPFWAKKDDGAWSIPKGEYKEGDDALETARREFQEETGFKVEGQCVPLQSLKQPSGKVVFGWAVEGDIDPKRLHSNAFQMEWPPKSGNQREFPEVDRGGWFGLGEARRKLLPGQVPFLNQLSKILGEPEDAFSVYEDRSRE